MDDTLQKELIVVCWPRRIGGHSSDNIASKIEITFFSFKRAFQLFYLNNGFCSTSLKTRTVFVRKDETL